MRQGTCEKLIHEQLVAQNAQNAIHEERLNALRRDKGQKPLNFQSMADQLMRQMDFESVSPEVQLRRLEDQLLLLHTRSNLRREKEAADRLTERASRLQKDGSLHVSFIEGQ